MWATLEGSHVRLSPAEKDWVTTEATPFGDHIEFRGFDGNNETEQMSIARFLVDDLGRFERFKGRDFNSHTASVDAYRRMLGVFLHLRPSLAERTPPFLTAAEIIEILKERIHPEHRTQHAPYSRARCVVRVRS